MDATIPRHPVDHNTWYNSGRIGVRNETYHTVAPEMDGRKLVDSSRGVDRAGFVMVVVCAKRRTLTTHTDARWMRRVERSAIVVHDTPRLWHPQQRYHTCRRSVWLIDAKV